MPPIKIREIACQESQFHPFSEWVKLMTTDSDPTLSDPALAGLFGEALKVGVHAPPPEPPDWLSDEAFPHALVRYVGR